MLVGSCARSVYMPLFQIEADHPGKNSVPEPRMLRKRSAPNLLYALFACSLQPSRPLSMLTAWSNTLRSVEILLPTPPNCRSEGANCVWSGNCVADSVPRCDRCIA
jgi:hypothetical protein